MEISLLRHQALGSAQSSQPSVSLLSHFVSGERSQRCGGCGNTGLRFYALKPKEFSAPVRNGRNRCSLNHSNRESLSLPSSTCVYLPRRTFQLRNRNSKVQTRALQAVTTDGDSSNGDGVGSSNHAMNLSSVWSSPDNVRPFMVSSLHGLQEGLRSVKWSEFASRGASTWQNQEPWIKFPLAIFACAILTVSALFGTTVALDLIPLWIIGPLIAGLFIRSACFVADLARKGVSSTRPLQEAVAKGAVQAWEDAQKGELLSKLQAAIEQKNLEMKQEAAKRWSDFVFYLKSGQAATDFKSFLLVLFSRFSDWSTETYEDFTDWVRPYWRAFTRLMKKLF